MIGAWGNQRVDCQREQEPDLDSEEGSRNVITPGWIACRAINGDSIEVTNKLLPSASFRDHVGYGVLELTEYQEVAIKGETLLFEANCSSKAHGKDESTCVKL